MNQQDYDQFGAMLEAMAELYGRTVKPVQTAMYFRALADYPIVAVQAAFDAHAKCPERGRFFPLPADLLAKLQSAIANDGRPSAEEAWSVAIRAADEAQTVVWTVETERAWWDVAAELMSIGDRFNASRGFIAKYTELVTAARKRGEPVRWIVTQGTDKNLRDQAVRDAFSKQRITREQAMNLLPFNGDAGPVVEAIAGKVIPLISNRQRQDQPPERVAEVRNAGMKLAALLNNTPAAQQDRRPDEQQLRRIVMSAVDAGVLTTTREIDHWMTLAANREDLSELQLMILESRRHA